nr:hypothetical protein [Bacillota bacterium]
MLNKILNYKPRRIIATLLLAVIVLMSIYGVKSESVGVERQAAFLIYWGVFFLLFIVLIFLILVDFLAIRASYMIAERKIFKSTLGSDEMRKMLRNLEEELKRLDDGQRPSEDDKGGSTPV